MGLMSSAAEPWEQAVRDGARWLVEHQLPDGLWEPTLLGVYFLDLWYHDDLLASGYALQALGRYRRGIEGR